MRDRVLREQVACRQFGYARATIVTDCMALYKLDLDSIPIGDEPWWNSTFPSLASKRGRLYRALCPERDPGEELGKACPGVSMEVQSETDFARFDQLDWVGYNAEVHVLRRNATTNVLSSDLLEEKRFEPLDGPMPPRSSCSGAEDDISACFQSQVQRRMSIKKTHQKLRPQTHLCMSKLLVGCSDDTALAPGTWVIGAIGDKHAYKSNLASPKIFERFGGPYSCSTGRKLVAEELREMTERNAHDLCWGRVWFSG